MLDTGYSTFELRCRAVAAVARGEPQAQVAAAFGIDRITLYRWLRRFRAEGARGLTRRPVNGRPRLGVELDLAGWRGIVAAPASDFGFDTDLWTVPRVRIAAAERYGVHLSRDTVWRRLREAGLTYQKPERAYLQRDDAARAEWRRVEVPRIRAAVEEFRALLYFVDEANVSLTAFLGKTWAPSGQTPTTRVTGTRGGVAAVSAIHPRGGLVFRLYDRRIASPQVIEFLAQLLAHHPRRHVVAVMDQAPPHVSKATKAFVARQRRLHLFHLPKYSPDWNPDEKVWNHLKHQELKSHTAKTKAELIILTERKLSKMARDPAMMRGVYHRCCVADLFG